MWKEILKSEFSTSPEKGTSEHGIQITKMYMFLKRYFADEHTPQFKKIYVTLDQMNDYTFRRLEDIMENARLRFDNEFILDELQLLEKDEILPGFYWFGGDSYEGWRFDDERHKSLRDEFIRNSYEGRRNYTNRVGSRWDAVPASRTIQSFWYSLERVIKKSKNRYWSERYY